MNKTEKLILDVLENRNFKYSGPLTKEWKRVNNIDVQKYIFKDRSSDIYFINDKTDLLVKIKTRGRSQYITIDNLTNYDNDKYTEQNVKLVNMILSKFTEGRISITYKHIEDNEYYVKYKGWFADSFSTLVNNNNNIMSIRLKQ